MKLTFYSLGPLEPLRLLLLLLLINFDYSNGFVTTTISPNSNQIESGVVFDDKSSSTATTTTSSVSSTNYTMEVLNDTTTISKPTVTLSSDNINRTVRLAEMKLLNIPKFKPKRDQNVENYPNKNLTNGWFSAESELMERSDTDSDTEFEDISANSSTANGMDFYRDDCQFCPETRFMQHYFSKGCIAMELQVKCVPKFCPKYFDCPKEEELPKDGCRHNSVLYQFGDPVPLADPCQHCRCINSTNGAQLNCATDECFNSWNEIPANCYRKYTENKCCPDIVCLDKRTKTLPTCAFEGKTHKLGDYFSPNDDPCYNCLCNDKWNQSLALVNNVESELKLDSVCKRVECNFDQDRAEHQNCVPVYSDKACCPVYYHCPEEHHNKDANEPKCKFGDNMYRIGEKVKLKQHEVCLECSCLVPPEITCKHRTCQSKPANCTSIYDEGECCPRFDCKENPESSTASPSIAIGSSTTPTEIYEEESGESESETLNQENSENSHRIVEKVEEEHHQIIRKCSPIDECKEPCKLIIEHDHDDDDDDDDEDSDDDPHHHHDNKDHDEQDKKRSNVEPKCPICRCNLDPATLKAIEIIDNRTMAMENATGTPSSLVNTTTTTTETNAEQQLASSISATIVNATITEENKTETSSMKPVDSTTTATTTTTKMSTKIRNGKQCPDIACEYPCYIYQMSPVGCPQCSCQEEPENSPNLHNRMRNHNNKTKSFLATRNLTIRT